jgi:hypothetical protein
LYYDIFFLSRINQSERKYTFEDLNPESLVFCTYESLRVILLATNYFYARSTGSDGHINPIFRAPFFKYRYYLKVFCQSIFALINPQHIFKNAICIRIKIRFVEFDTINFKIIFIYFSMCWVPFPVAHQLISKIIFFSRVVIL